MPKSRHMTVDAVPFMPVIAICCGQWIVVVCLHRWQHIFYEVIFGSTAAVKSSCGNTFFMKLISSTAAVKSHGIDEVPWAQFC